MQNDEEQESLTWSWFLSADFRGDWIVTQGYADVLIVGTKISGVMCFHDRCGYEDAVIYAHFFGNIDSEDFVVMTVASAQEGVPSFDVSGPIFNIQKERLSASTIVLTDGTTVIGFSRQLEKQD